MTHNIVIILNNRGRAALYGADNAEKLEEIAKEEHMSLPVREFTYYGKRVTQCETLRDVLELIRRKSSSEGIKALNEQNTTSQRYNKDADVIADQIIIEEYLEGLR